MSDDRIDIGRHLATFNLFREGDGSLHITVADAHGVKMELGPSQLPVYPMAMKALIEAVRHLTHNPEKEE